MVRKQNIPNKILHMVDVRRRPCGCILLCMDLYHVLNRGVDKRTIFSDNQDYARFVHDMFEFNSTKPANNTYRGTMVDVGRRPYTTTPIHEHNNDMIVDIHGWCLMHNHYHLLLSERVESGISLFLKKLNGGYAKYFNERYERVGALFQGRTKKILIEREAHFLHILNYIHFNILDTLPLTSDWRALKIKDATLAMKHLENFRWSSYLDYIGTRNFPSILTTSLFQDVYQNNYKQQAARYLEDIELDTIQHLILEK